MDKKIFQDRHEDFCASARKQLTTLAGGKLGNDDVAIVQKDHVWRKMFLEVRINPT